MIPLSITLEGFMCYRERQKLEFDGAPLLVLAGPNGHGKSAIFDAITFALYDRHRGGGQHAEALINHRRDQLLVEFDFEVGGNRYRVLRTVRKRGRSVQTTREAFRLAPSVNGGAPRIEPIPNTSSNAGFNDWVHREIGLNDKAFTSSVLLVQGKSDELLLATPEQRKDILTELIDLSPYEMLYRRVEGRCRHCELELKSLQSQLGSVSPVSDQELEEAQAAWQQAEEAWKEAQEKADHFATLLEQAKQWEELVFQQGQLQRELDQAAALLKREDEIRSRLAEWQELDQVIPKLRSISSLRERLAQSTGQLQRLQEEKEAAEAAEARKEEDHTKAANEAGCLEAEVKRLQAEGNALAVRQAELAPIVARLAHWEELEQKLEQNRTELSALPADLGRLLEKAEEQGQLLLELVSALPWLRDLAAERARLSQLQEQWVQTKPQLEELESQQSACEEERRPIVSGLEAARTAAEQWARAVARAETRHGDACKRRDCFLTAAGQERCSLCGQWIDATHAECERQRLADEVAAAENEWQAAKTNHQAALAARQQHEADLKALDEHRKALDEQRQRWETELNQARLDTKQCLERLRNGYQNLPAAYQTQVAADLPTSAAVWLTTCYPAVAELKTLQQKLDGRRAFEQRLTELRQQYQCWQRLDAERQLLKKQEGEAVALLDIPAARNARGEVRGLEESGAALRSQLENLCVGLRRASNAVEEARQAVQEWKRRIGKHETEIARMQAAGEEINHVIKTVIAVLPETWQEKASTLDTEGLEQQERTRANLSPYQDLGKRLEAARVAETGLAKRMAELAERVASLPEVARRPAGTVEHELDQARSERDAANAARGQAERHHKELQQQRGQRRQLEQQSLHAGRQHYLHHRLTGLLGSGGLQLALLRRAERGIVSLANETLAGLSRGRLHLELRGADGNGEGSSNKALDMVVRDLETGSRPMPVALASGSQKFRIAVSLALAIGRYSGGEARRIEAVIIDEGFGCLDRDGRDDIIQELQELQQKLKRIILVSHQEEFTDAFTCGYLV